MRGWVFVTNESFRLLSELMTRLNGVVIVKIIGFIFKSKRFSFDKIGA